MGTNKVITHYHHDPCWLGKLSGAKMTGLSYTTCKRCLKKYIKWAMWRLPRGNKDDNWWHWTYRNVIEIRQRLNEK